MSKAVLVLDEMPENCYECPCCDHEGGHCQAEGFEPVYGYRKPDWCPLKPMPERVKLTVKEGVEGGMTRDDVMRAAGWNACLKEIEAGDGSASVTIENTEPRVMTPADVNNIGPEDVCAFVEIREETHMYACYMRQYDETHTEIMCDVPDLPTKLNNGCARLWTSRPTDAQREATPWDVGTVTG